MPASAQKCLVESLANALPAASRYCLSFTAAGLRPELAAVIAGIHLQAGDWKRTKAAVLERNALQTRSVSTGKRLESELRQRLQLLSQAQLELLARGSSEERLAMAWLGVLKRIAITLELTRELLMDKLSSLDPVLRRSDMASFYDGCERQHPELAALSPSSQQKIRSALLKMLRDAGLLAGKAGKGGWLGTVQRPSLSAQAQQLVLEDDPALLGGFLLSPPRPETAKAANGNATKTVPAKTVAAKTLAAKNKAAKLKSTQPKDAKTKTTKAGSVTRSPAQSATQPATRSASRARRSA